MKSFKVDVYTLVNKIPPPEHFEEFFDDLTKAEEFASRYINKDNVILVSISKLDKDKYGFDEYQALQLL